MRSRLSEVSDEVPEIWFTIISNYDLQQCRNAICRNVRLRFATLLDYHLQCISQARVMPSPPHSFPFRPQQRYVALLDREGLTYMGQLFEELKRRSVFKVAAAYLVVGWVLVQVADTIAPMMSLPDTAPRYVLFLLIVPVSHRALPGVGI